MISEQTDNTFSYFIAVKKMMKNKKRFRLIFCIDKERPNVAGIITLFQVN
jgi:hypothetical protein